MPQTPSQTKSLAKAIPPSPSIPTAFRFTDLPNELQDQIWTFAAAAWNKKHLTYTYRRMWRVKSKQIYLLNIDVEQHYINPEKLHGVEEFAIPYMLKFPRLFFVCTASRAIMYDSMLNFASEEREPSGENMHLFLRNDRSQPENWAYPRVGCKATTLSSASSFLIILKQNQV